jgi:alanine racemase
MTMTGVPTARSLDLKEIFQQYGGRPTIAVVDLDALATNIAALRRLIGPRVRLMTVVKANAYGHGAVMLGTYALKYGADELAVATVDEAAELREGGVTAPILVMGPIGEGEVERALRLNVQLVVSSDPFARALAAGVRRLGVDPVPVHLKVDTGMRRFGCAPSEALSLARQIVGAPELRFAGLMTHFASADDPDPAFTFAQAAEFDAVVDELRANGVDVPVQHLANSAATLRFPSLHRDMVRTGIATRGLPPDPSMPLPAGFRPILSLYSRIARIIPLAAGDAVSYGRTYVSAGGERGALVPIGYGDGYPRALSSQGWMALDGVRADVLGRVCMDQTVVRVPDGVTVHMGDIVKIAGDGSGGEPTLNELAVMTGTIPHEIATRLTARVPKLYVERGRIIAIDDLQGPRAFSPTGEPTDW